jgi:hypothetical protein
MADGRSPRSVPVPLLLGEAAGRVRIPLVGRPDGVIAVTVPRKDSEGTVSVPLDRKGRPGWREADLVAEQPAQAFTPPAELNSKELAWFLETGGGGLLKRSSATAPGLSSLPSSGTAERWCGFP